MNITVTGASSFTKLSVAYDRAGGPSFDKHMNDGLEQAGEDLGRAVLTASDIYMPSGYEAAFAAGSRYTVELHRGRGLGATLFFYSRGRRGRREVERLEEGKLRAPNWGRTRPLKAGGRYAKKPENIRGGVYRNPWHEQRIRPHFFSEPVKYATPQAMKRLDQAYAEVFKEIGKAA